jgi:hypothetical protein
VSVRLTEGRMNKLKRLADLREKSITGMIEEIIDSFPDLVQDQSSTQHFN